VKASTSKRYAKTDLSSQSRHLYTKPPHIDILPNYLSSEVTMYHILLCLTLAILGANDTRATKNARIAPLTCADCPTCANDEIVREMRENAQKNDARENGAQMTREQGAKSTKEHTANRFRERMTHRHRTILHTRRARTGE